MVSSPEDVREASYTDPSIFLDDDVVARNVLSAVAETRLEQTPSGNVRFPAAHQQDSFSGDQSWSSRHDCDLSPLDSTVSSAPTKSIHSSPMKGQRPFDTGITKNSKEVEESGIMSPKLSPRRAQRSNMADLEYCEDLVVATAVYDNLTIDSSDDGYMPTCIEFDPDSKPAALYRNKFYRRMVYVSCIAIGVIVGAVVFAVKSTTGVNKNEMEWMRNEVETMIGTKMEMLDLPYQKALTWMMNDDPLRYEFDSESVEFDVHFYQRYFLTYFYFATTIVDNTEWAYCAPPKLNDDTSCSYKFDVHHVDTSTFKQGNRWLSNSNACTWAGVECSSNDEVEFLRTDSFELSGTFPDGIQYLSTLNKISFVDSNLRGRLPIDIIRRLPRLESLYLGSNQFTGSIPDQWFNDKNISLIVLDLSTNLLTGTLPSKMGVAFDSLTSLVLFNNRFMGSIPDDVMGGLLSLLLSMNQLTGTIPSSIGRLTNLRLLDMTGNNLEGTIPTEFGMLKEKIVEITIGSNQLTGEVPNELYEMKNLVRFDVSNNRLNGTLNGLVTGGGPPALEFLRINQNEFSGSIPNEMESMIHLEEFIFGENDFTGTIPDELCQFVSERCCRVSCCTVDGKDCPATTTTATVAAAANDTDVDDP